MLSETGLLSKKEFRRLGIFLRSPYFNKYRTIKKLYSYLKVHFPDFNKRNLSLRQISIAVYGEENAGNDKVRKLVSDFKMLVQKFILYETVTSEDAGHRLILLSALRKKMMYGLYRSRLAEMKIMRKQEFGMDEKYYMNRMNYYNEMYMSSFSENGKMAPYYSVKKHLYLNYYFIYQSLVYNYNVFSEIGAESNFTKLHSEMIDFVFGIIEKNIGHFSSSYPDIVTLYFANKMLLTKNILYYNRLLKYYKQNRKKFDYNLHTMYYIVSENCLKLMLREDDSRDVKRKLFMVRKEMLSSGHTNTFFLEGRRITAGIFFRIFDDAVNLKEFEWAVKFVEETKKYIPESERDEILNTVTMILKFFSGDVLDIFEFINKTKKKNTVQFIYSRIIKMMMLYETGGLKALMFETEAFKKYLQRKQKTITDAPVLIKKSHVFNGCMRQLAKFRLKSPEADRKEFLKFETSFYKNKLSPVYGFWFEEKIEEIDRSVGRRKRVGA